MGRCVLLSEGIAPPSPLLVNMSVWITPGWIVTACTSGCSAAKISINLLTASLDVMYPENEAAMEAGKTIPAVENATMVEPSFLVGRNVCVVKNDPKTLI